MLSYDVIIIGGGLAGTTAGAFLTTEAKKKVLILEQASQIGGRATSFRGEAIKDIAAHKKVLGLAALSYISDRSEPSFEEMVNNHMLDGYVLESGVRGAWGGNLGRVCKVMEYYNKASNFYANQGFVAIGIDGDYTAKEFTHAAIPEWMTEEDLVELMKIGRAINKVKTKADTKAYDKVTLKDFMTGITDNKKAIEFYSNLCTYHTVINDPALNTAGEDMRVNLIFKSYKAEKNVSIVNGGWSFAGTPGHRYLSDSLVDVIELNGGNVMKNASVKEVMIKDGAVCGVVADVAGVEYTFMTDTVVATVRAHEIPGILPIEQLDEAFQIAAKRTVRAGCLSCYMALDRSIIDFAPKKFGGKSFIWNPILARAEEGFRGDIPLVAVNLGAIAPTRAPEGKHLHAWVANLLADESADPSKVDLIIYRMHDFWNHAFPGWRKACDWLLFLVNKGALIWRYPEDPHPDVVCKNIKGLYFAGENYGTDVSCQGIEGATQSALFCVEAISGLDLREKVLGDSLA